MATSIAGNGRYEVIQELGRGAFGRVQLARNVETGDQVAIKSIGRRRINKYVETEILNHRMLQHPHIIKLKEVFLTSQHICIAMEYANGGTLFDFVSHNRRLDEAICRWFFQQLIVGLDYSHRRGVVNRDIKLENTLLDNVIGVKLPLIKLCDFGYSKAQFMSAPKSEVGTLPYMAPEVLTGNGTVNYDGKLADIWSSGVMLYVMLVGWYPFGALVPPADAKGVNKDAQRLQMITRILAAQWSIPPDLEVSKECLDLLSGLLTADPARRLTMAQIKASPWFLFNLPSDALQKNDTLLASTDYTGVQTVEQIQAILRAAWSA